LRGVRDEAIWPMDAVGIHKPVRVARLRVLAKPCLRRLKADR